jgi:hypothetical protein
MLVTVDSNDGTEWRKSAQWRPWMRNSWSIPANDSYSPKVKYLVVLNVRSLVVQYECSLVELQEKHPSTWWEAV